MPNTSKSQQPHFGFMLDDGIDLKKIGEQLFQYKWFILAAGCCGLLLAFLYTFTIQPEYQTTAVLQIRSRQPQGANLLSKIGYNNSNSISDINTQEALIKTRYILEPVITKTGLNIITSARYFPIFGRWMAQRYQGTDPATPLLGLTSYAWGGEKINVKKFTVPKYLQSNNFKIIVGKNNTYQLLSGEGNLLLTGEVGKEMTDTKSGITIELSTLKAHPGTTFALRYASPLNLIKSLARKIRIDNIFGNDPTQGTGIFQIQLTDNDPEQAKQILNTILYFVVLKDIQEKSQQTLRNLDYLNQRLPKFKNQLAKSENAVNQYHIKKNVLSMVATANFLTRKYSSLDQAIYKIQSQRQELLQSYTAEHPRIISMMRKEEELLKQLGIVKQQIREFPLQYQEEINLTREAKIKNAVYIKLLSNQEQLEMEKGGRASDIIVLSDALPPGLLPTHKLLLTLMGFLLSSFLAALIILIKKALHKTVENAEQIEDELNINVRTILPFSRKQKELEKAHKKNLRMMPGLVAPLILAKQESDDITIESMRSLRISLHVMNNHEEKRIISFMGSVSNIGKSFVSLNFSQVIADHGKRTLLIDADIRRGRLHTALHQAKSKGLSEYLEGQCDYDDLVRPIHENLFFIACGHYTSHPLKLFQSQRFRDLINKVRNDFDQVIIDTPPILPVSDAILIAAQSDIQLFVVSAGQDKIADVKHAIKKAKSHQIEITGLILNHRKPATPFAASYYRYAYGKSK